MCDLLIQKTVPAEECERFANALTGRECRCDPSKLYTISVRAHGVAEQHQGEPVAWLWEHVNGLRICTTSERAPFTNKHATPPNCKKTPLYTHADPGEVERLREGRKLLIEELERRDSTVDTLRSELRTQTLRADAAVGDANEAERKLAERDALLRDISNVLDSWRSTDDLEEISDRVAAMISASAEPSAPKFSDNWTPPDTIKIQITAEEMKRLGLKDPAAPKYCGKVKVVYGHGDYGRCGSDERSPGIPAQCDDCKNAKVVDMPTIVINDDEQMPDIVYDSCQFIGRNADGSEPFTFGTTADGRRTITKIDFRGWKCYGPMQDEPSAPVERDERAMTKAFNDWAFYKKGEAIGRMDGQQAALEGFIAGADWQARAALERKP